jgi:hypothetical protein
LQFNQGQSDVTDALAADSINATTFKNKVAGDAQLAGDLGLKASDPYLGNRYTAPNDPNPMPLEPYMTPANTVAQQNANSNTVEAGAADRNSRKPSGGGGDDDNGGRIKIPNGAKVFVNYKTRERFYVVPPKYAGDPERWVNTVTGAAYGRPDAKFILNFRQE